jgi:hypothetical protein
MRAQKMMTAPPGAYAARHLPKPAATISAFAVTIHFPASARVALSSGRQTAQGQSTWHGGYNLGGASHGYRARACAQRSQRAEARSPRPYKGACDREHAP